MVTDKKETRLLTGEGKVSSILRKDTILEGSLIFEEPVQIEGRFEGDIRCKSALIVSKSGVVHANITAKSIVVYGEIVGNIETTQQLELKETAKLIGNVRTAKLTIADGVVFEGHCEMIYPD